MRRSPFSCILSGQRGSKTIQRGRSAPAIRPRRGLLRPDVRNSGAINNGSPGDGIGPRLCAAYRKKLFAAAPDRPGGVYPKIMAWHASLASKAVLMSSDRRLWNAQVVKAFWQKRNFCPAQRHQPSQLEKDLSEWSWRAIHLS